MNQAPHGIAHEVVATDASLRLPSSNAPLQGLAIGAVAVVASLLAITGITASLGAIVVALGWPLAVLGVLVTAGGTVAAFNTFLSVLAVLWVSTRTTPLEITPGQAVFDGAVVRSVVPLAPLILRGEVGQPVKLLMGRQLLREFEPMWTEQGWNQAAITWVAQHASSLLGQPLDDQRDLDDWRRWESDPVYRATLAFDRAARVNENAHPTFHKRTAAPASWVKADHHGLTWRNQEHFFETPVHATLSNTHLHLGDRRIALHTIDRVRVHVDEYRSKYGSTFQRHAPGPLAR